MPRKCDRVTTSQIAYLYGERLSAREIATRLGCGRSTVLRRLHEAGISLRHTRDYGYKRRGKRIAPHRRDIFDKHLIDLYKAGLSTTAIADQVGCHETTIWRRLKNAGTELRPAGFDRQKVATLRIVCLYAEGLTAREVATKLGCARSTVTRRLHQAGISRRSLRGHRDTKSAKTQKLSKEKVTTQPQRIIKAIAS